MCLHACTCVYACVHKRITQVAFFHWQSNSLSTFTQGGSRRFKLLQAAVSLNQCPSYKQDNKRCLPSSHLFFKKNDCALSISSDYLLSQVIDLFIGQQSLGCTQHSVTLFRILCMSWLPTGALQSQSIDFTCFWELIELESSSET